MISAVALILSCQLAGEAFVRSTGLPIPGPVLGMASLLIGMQLLPQIRDLVGPVANSLLGNLLLLFVPAGVGAILQLPQMGAMALPLILAITASTLLAMIAAAWAFVGVARLMGDTPEDKPEARTGENQ